MYKLVIFDLDGVLYDSKEIHFQALNIALEKVEKKFVISFSFWLIFNGRFFNSNSNLKEDVVFITNTEH